MKKNLLFGFAVTTLLTGAIGNVFASDVRLSTHLNDVSVSGNYTSPTFSIGSNDKYGKMTYTNNGSGTVTVTLFKGSSDVGNFTVQKGSQGSTTFSTLKSGADYKIKVNAANSSDTVTGRLWFKTDSAEVREFTVNSN